MDSEWIYDSRSKHCIKRIQAADEDAHGLQEDFDMEIAQFAQAGYQNRSEGALHDFDPHLEGWHFPG